jgi:hypothetical protein
MAEEYDTVKDLADRHQHAEDLEAGEGDDDERQRRLDRWNEAWGPIQYEATTAAVAKLAEALVEFGAGLWLDYLDVCLTRQQELAEWGAVADRDGQTITIGAGYTFELVAVRLLKLAFLNRHSEAVDALIRAAEMHVLDGIRICLENYKSRLKNWCISGLFPDSPPISQTEFFEYCGGRLDGFSKGSISEIWGNGLETFDISTVGTNRHYAKCRHAQRQGEILKFLVAGMKKSESNCFSLASDSANIAGIDD